MLFFYPSANQAVVLSLFLTGFILLYHITLNPEAFDFWVAFGLKRATAVFSRCLSFANFLNEKLFELREKETREYTPSKVGRLRSVEPSFVSPVRV